MPLRKIQVGERSYRREHYPATGPCVHRLNNTCGLHHRPCVELGTPPGGWLSCDFCYDYQPESAEFRAEVEATLAAIAGKAEARASTWHTSLPVVRAHRLAFAAAKEAASAATPPDNFKGRGIVVCAGNAVYFTASWVMISILRRHGCKLPVEVWFLGREEMDWRMEKLLHSLGDVTCKDAKHVALASGSPPRILRGWEAKVFAIRQSQYREVLYLDADQVPTCDPSYLFDAPEFRTAGAVFWPDYPPHGWTITRTAFQVAGLPVPGGERPGKGKEFPNDYTPFESGQILIDKARHWPGLTLAAWCNDHSDFFFPRPGWHWHIYGDKDTFYLAWRSLGASLAMPPACSWIGGDDGGAFLQRDFSGRVIFQHRCQPHRAKWRLHGPNLKPAGFLFHDWAEEALADLRSRWTGQPWAWVDQDQRDAWYADGMIGKRFVLVRRGQGPMGADVRQTITLNACGEVHGGADTERFWRVEHREGEPLLILCSWKQATAILGLDSLGNWQNQGAGVFLVPATMPGDWQLREVFDQVVFDSVCLRNEYRLPERFEPGDVILDVGGHIGCFAHACIQRGAGKVFVVEPNPANLDYLRRHLACYGSRVIILPVAAWRSDLPAGKAVLNYPSGAEHLAGGSITTVHGKEGSEVATMPFDAILEQAAAASPNGRIRLVKFDCEGAEFPIIATSKLLHLVDQIVGEYHAAPHELKEDSREVAGGEHFSAERLQRDLERLGFDVTLEGFADGGRLGHIWAKRPLVATVNPEAAAR